MGRFARIRARRGSQQMNRHNSGREAITGSPVVEKPGIRFTERMVGHFALEGGVARKPEEFEAAEKRGEREGTSFEFVLTIISDDLDQLIEDERHEARMEGTVVA